MSNSKNNPNVDGLKRSVFKVAIYVGNTLTAIGCLGLIFGLAGVISLEDFSVGLSSGIRLIGTVAIAGCLLSTVGYGLLDSVDKQ